jgi:hypothetical protein
MACVRHHCEAERGGPRTLRHPPKMRHTQQYNSSRNEINMMTTCVQVESRLSMLPITPWTREPLWGSGARCLPPDKHQQQPEKHQRQEQGGTHGMRKATL